jgi:GTP-binding protein HflX
LAAISPRKGRYEDNEGSLEELASLAKTAGARVVDGITQKKHRIDPNYYIGKGKAFELASLCSDRKIDVVICDDDLTPAQVKTLEKTLNSKVIDRSELILDIFAHRASTRQAQVQVELAQLEYTQPRLKRMWTHLDRYEGGIGTRGPGEKQLEVDRRLVSKKIHELKKQLTLDTKTCILFLGNGRKILLSDTVGFIKKLPHHLVASFHATLEEVRQADLLLHVVDTSSPAVIEQVRAVNGVLKELGADKKPAMLVLNKIDLLTDDTITTLFKAKYPHAVSVSASGGLGLEQLKKELVAFLEDRCVDIKLTCSAAEGRLPAYLYDNGHVLSKRVVGDKLHFHVLLEEKYLAKVKKLSPEAVISYPAGAPLRL